jgi:hypothetical protein
VEDNTLKSLLAVRSLNSSLLSSDNLDRVSELLSELIKRDSKVGEAISRDCG